MKGTAYRVQGLVVIIIFALTIRYTLYPPPSLAQEATESGLIQKLNQLKTEIASKAAQIKTEINKKVQNKAFMGTILDIGSNEISLETLNGVKTVKYDEFTEIIGAKNKKIKIETLESNDKIAALGDVDDKNNVIVQKLIYLDSLASNSAQLIWGQIQKSTGATITVITKDGQTQNISTNSQTQILLGQEEATVADAKVEKHLLVRGTRLKDGSLRARFIYFIPSMGFTKPQEKSTALPKAASPSALIKPSPKS